METVIKQKFTEILAYVCECFFKIKCVQIFTLTKVCYSRLHVIHYHSEA